MKTFLAALLILALLGLCACNQREKPLQPETIAATEAYRAYFGPAPSSDKGRCYAFVIYFPRANPKGKVVPFPFFSFDEPTLKKVAVERLLGGMDVAAYRGEFLNPFPAGTQLLSLTEKKGRVTVDLSRFGGDDPLLQSAARNALALTLGQFPGVQGVDMLLDGHRTRLHAPGAAAVQAPGPPRLLSVAATKERSASQVEDVSALFDRPVEIRTLQLLTDKGDPLPGEIYHSVFDMAGVLKPKSFPAVKRGMPIKVRWSVVDRMGREGSGEEVRPLELHEH